MVDYSSYRYTWDTDDADWDQISSGSLNRTELFIDGFSVTFEPAFVGSVRKLVSGFRRDVDDQLWLGVAGIYGTAARSGFTGLSGTGDQHEDAETLKVWCKANLVPDGAWPDLWYTAKVIIPVVPIVVVPDPVSPSEVEEADYGHLRTQFRRQSVLRRRNA